MFGARIQKVDIYQRNRAGKIIFETLRLHFERGRSMLCVEMKNEHTPTPWSYSDERGLTGPDNQIIACIIDSRATTQEEQDSNAAHIVRCVNSHDELLAALKVFVGQFDPAALCEDDLSDTKYAKAARLAYAAIAKAEAQ